MNLFSLLRVYRILLVVSPSTSWVLFSFWKSEYRQKGFFFFQGCGFGLFLSFLWVCNFLSTWAFFHRVLASRTCCRPCCPSRCCCGHTLSSLSCAACSPVCLNSHLLCAALHELWGWKPVCIPWSHLWGGCSKLPEIAFLHEHLWMG